jgi:hypothetical protein
MFSERGYLTFITRALARKPPQGLIVWCCSCCLPKAARDETGGVKVIHICPRTEDNCEEDCSIDGEELVPVQKMYQAPTKERRYSHGRKIEPYLVKQDHVPANEEWNHNIEREVDVPMLRKHLSSDIEKRYEDSHVNCEDVKIPMIRMHHVHGDDGDEGRIIEIYKQSHLGLLTLLSGMLKYTCIQACSDLEKVCPALHTKVTV